LEEKRQNLEEQRHNLEEQVRALIAKHDVLTVKTQLWKGNTKQTIEALERQVLAKDASISILTEQNREEIIKTESSSNFIYGKALEFTDFISLVNHSNPQNDYSWQPQRAVIDMGLGIADQVKCFETLLTFRQDYAKPLNDIARRMMEDPSLSCIVMDAVRTHGLAELVLEDWVPIEDLTDLPQHPQAVVPWLKMWTDTLTKSYLQLPQYIEMILNLGVDFDDAVFDLMSTIGIWLQPTTINGTPRWVWRWEKPWDGGQRKGM
jgi:hypothetical protein